ncbi:MAG TPA: hypothetical protein VEQ63_02520, partial [Bryobacteraceae bacterium]|nr:hypothetical protein [Bryobacteraceae bacterium]
AMVGMGSLVTRSVGDFHLSFGHPAVPVGCVCRCGHPLARFSDRPAEFEVTCSRCGRRYRSENLAVSEL